ncbi:hypothetical protein SAMN04488117_102264 [Celeribacter baekdonensis]|uniref:DUF5333 domain-containing protein n=1 Tax=Celeribacter baekdonensis TaxID=875171 RepID=A0A1G7IC22_9RHOB|nr:DUF5333 domain-containing protein [Celeribacter baekdonensis]SDF10118.1 hypothetical protein SAMN04488117_102264 [Celeribacter baekdonensis]
MSARLTYHAALVAMALLAAPAVAQAQKLITEDAKVKEIMVQSLISTRLISECDTIAPRKAQLKKQTAEMVAYIDETGYGSAQIILLRDESYLAQLAQAADDMLSARGVNPNNTKALCAFGTAEIAGKTALGKLMKNR